MRHGRSLQGKRRRVARAAQPALGRVQPQLAALVGAHTSDRLQLGIGPVNEPVHGAQVEREGSALRKIDACADGPPRSGVGLELTRQVEGMSPTEFARVLEQVTAEAQQLLQVMSISTDEAFEIMLEQVLEWSPRRAMRMEGPSIEELEAMARGGSASR